MAEKVLRDENRLNESLIQNAVKFHKPGHSWSGWPGAWCLHCGCEDPMEIALADGDYVETNRGEIIFSEKAIENSKIPCTPVRFHNWNPYLTEREKVEVNKRLQAP